MPATVYRSNNYDCRCNNSQGLPPRFGTRWETIKDIGEMERHIHRIQHQYRILASTWILAIFAAASFILANEELDSILSSNKELAVVMLTFFGGVGITLLWTIKAGSIGLHDHPT